MSRLIDKTKKKPFNKEVIISDIKSIINDIEKYQTAYDRLKQNDFEGALKLNSEAKEHEDICNRLNIENTFDNTDKFITNRVICVVGIFNGADGILNDEIGKQNELSENATYDAGDYWTAPYRKDEGEDLNDVKVRYELSQFEYESLQEFLFFRAVFSLLEYYYNEKEILLAKEKVSKFENQFLRERYLRIVDLLIAENNQLDFIPSEIEFTMIDDIIDNSGLHYWNDNDDYFELHEPYVQNYFDKIYFTYNGKPVNFEFTFDIEYLK